MGMQFVEILKLIKEKYNAIIVAIESGKDNKMVANPPMDYTIQAGDDLILIAQERPHFGK